MKPEQKPYGLWDSPITAEALSLRNRLSAPAWAGDGETLVWVEGRSDLSFPVAWHPSQARYDLTSLSPVRGQVGYGGGELAVHQDRMFLVHLDGRLYSCDLLGQQKTALTPPFGGCASPAPAPDGKTVAYVHSDGKTDALCIVDTAGGQWPQKLAWGADFYMQPAWSPNGKQIAWIEWDHPNMPWDDTRLVLADFSAEQGKLTQKRVLSGGSGVCAAQPVFSPDGRWLAFIEESGEWQDLILINLANLSRHVLVHGAGFELMRPAWQQGNCSLAWHPSSQSLFSVRSQENRSSLRQIFLDGRTETIPVEGITEISHLAVSSNGQIALLGSGPTVPERVMVVQDGRQITAGRSEDESVDSRFLPDPQPMRWTAEDGTELFGILSRPANPLFTATGLPPAIINIHGGPTSAATLGYQASTAWFTSRGYAVLELNYRGSTGYGRAYRNALRERWGEADTADAAAAAGFLSQNQLADPHKLVIRGGSAGGFTVYNSLIHHPGTFKAGVCFYGVSNLFTLDLDTHKFEAHYTRSLVGQLPEASARFHAWSPVYHAGNIRDALIIFQGEEDKVVPPSQSNEIVEILRRKGTLVEYHLYPGEGHGFWLRQNILAARKAEERFLLSQVIFSV